MNKKAESQDGIGIFGVMIAIILVLAIRGCVTNVYQDKINSYCQESGYDFGEETIRDTLILCQNYNNSNTSKIPYNQFEEYTDSSSNTSAKLTSDKSEAT